MPAPGSPKPKLPGPQALIPCSPVIKKVPVPCPNLIVFYYPTTSHWVGVLKARSGRGHSVYTTRLLPGSPASTQCLFWIINTFSPKIT